jgi:hypothetical protein
MSACRVSTQAVAPVGRVTRETGAYSCSFVYSAGGENGQVRGMGNVAAGRWVTVYPNWTKYPEGNVPLPI